MVIISHSPFIQKRRHLQPRKLQRHKPKLNCRKKNITKWFHNRIQPFLDPLISWTQNGFRKFRSTLYNIITLRRIIEGRKLKEMSLAFVFIDFSKAFDSIDRDRMFKILSSYGIPNSLIDAIKLIYEDSRAKVITPDGDTQYFDKVAGIFQGGTLAPFLFIIVLDYCMCQAYENANPGTGIEIERRNGSRRQGVRIFDSSYADDIALLNKTLEQAEHMLHCVENSATMVGGSTSKYFKNRIVGSEYTRWGHN